VDTLEKLQALILANLFSNQITRQVLKQYEETSELMLVVGNVSLATILLIIEIIVYKKQNFLFYLKCF
jgi:Na+/proline symporter